MAALFPERRFDDPSGGWLEPDECRCPTPGHRDSGRLQDGFWRGIARGHSWGFCGAHACGDYPPCASPVGSGRGRVGSLGHSLFCQWRINFDMALSACSALRASRIGLWRSKMNLNALADRPAVSALSQRVCLDPYRELMSLSEHDRKYGARLARVLGKNSSDAVGLAGMASGGRRQRA